MTARRAGPSSARHATDEPISSARSVAKLVALVGATPQKPLDLDAWRVVESQTLTSTRRLVDSDDEQELLEQLVDRVKPPVPPGPGFEGLHFLLYTPFRHPPLRNGSRFGTRQERGLWYGSLEVTTALAEVAYYRLVFLEGTAAMLPLVTVELSAFQTRVAARRALDLAAAPFDEHRGILASKTQYDATQSVGRAMRAAGVEAFLFASARAIDGGTNLALFEPTFGRKVPTGLRTYRCTVARDKVEFARKDVLRRARERAVFPREQFEVEGKLPMPAL